ncbi:MAG TPA: hypothetical protein VLV89_10340 [Candidatus Acidoferrum sp.]|nr:hypothetical protein [Candidatus Acidoferrum sp.]
MARSQNPKPVTYTAGRKSRKKTAVRHSEVDVGRELRRLFKLAATKNDFASAARLAAELQNLILAADKDNEDNILNRPRELIIAAGKNPRCPTCNQAIAKITIHIVDDRADD